MTPVQSAKVVAILMAAFPSAHTSTQMSSVYERMLADLDYAAADAAIERLLATARFMPTIAEVREATLALTVGEQRPGVDAWGDVIALRNYRNRDAVDGLDPIVVDICQRYGWIETRTLWRNGEDIEQWHVVTGENESADRARFAELYDQLARKTRREQNTSQLPAAQRLREIETKRRTQIAERTGSADGSVFGKVLALASGGGDS